MEQRRPGDSVCDFIYTWRRNLTPETGCDYVAQLYFIRGAKAFNEGETGDFSTVGIRAPDDRTLIVELDNPVPFFLDLCAFVTLYPVHRATLEEHGDEWIKPGKLVGNGAYLLKAWRLHVPHPAGGKPALLGPRQYGDEVGRCPADRRPEHGAEFFPQWRCRSDDG
ncbi:MAG: ABC transporter substrate-binding protein [Verrucomicrobiales bacterium]